MDKGNVIVGAWEGEGVFVDCEADLGGEGEETALRLGVHRCCSEAGTVLGGGFGVRFATLQKGGWFRSSGEWKAWKSFFMRGLKMFTRAQRTRRHRRVAILTILVMRLGLRQSE